jgi:hypothetical protein
MTLDQVRAAVSEVLNDMNAAEAALESQGPEWRAAGDTEAIEATESFISECEVMEQWYLSFLKPGERL